MRTLRSALHPVVCNATLEEVLNLIGTFVFAVSGALLAVRKHYHIVGMAVFAEITAIGGEVIHDLVIGAVPPVAFTDASYFWIALLAIGVTFFRTCAEKLWSYTTGGAIVSALAVANGMLYVGSLDGTVYAFTSDIVWSYTTGGRVESSPAMAGGD